MLDFSTQDFLLLNFLFELWGRFTTFNFFHLFADQILKSLYIMCDLYLFALLPSTITAKGKKADQFPSLSQKNSEILSPSRVAQCASVSISNRIKFGFVCVSELDLRAGAEALEFQRRPLRFFTRQMMNFPLEYAAPRHTEHRGPNAFAV